MESAITADATNSTRIRDAWYYINESYLAVKEPSFDTN